MFDGPGVADLMSKVRDLCGAFNSSTQLMDRLKNIQLSLDAEKPALVLIQDVVTRWWSTHQQIERVLKLKNVLLMMDLQDVFPTSFYIDDAGWASLKIMEEFQRPFKFVQQFLEGECMLEIVPDIAQSTHGIRNIFVDIRNIPTRPHMVLGMFLLPFPVIAGHARISPVG